MSGIQQAIESIQKNYTKLSVDCIRDLASSSTLRPVEKGEVLVKEGALSDKLYFIITGSARAYYVKEGREITDWFAFENDFICAINSFFMQVPSPHYIEVLEQGEVIEFLREDTFALGEKYHEFERLTRIAVTKTMLQLQQRIVSLQFETAQQRYENLVAIRADIVKRVPLGCIASFLGITQETLSRIRAQKARI